MSNKSKIIIGIILLAVGAGLVPTGFFMNQYLIDQVYGGVPEALLKIQDDATEGLEEQIPALGTPDVLSGIEDEALLQLEAQLPVLATPQILDELKDEAIAQLPALINCTTAANLINETVDSLILAYGLDIGTNIFFNDPTFQVDLSGMGLGPFFKGISNFTGVNMGYTLTARQTLLFDGISVPGVGDVPGLVNDTDLGMGVCGFLKIYNASLTNYLLNQTIQVLYNASWLQLTTIAGWLQLHVFPDVVPTAFFAQYQMTVSEAVNYGFYYQWANGTLVPNGIDLNAFRSGVPPNTTGLEAGIPNPTNITLPTSMDLWDDSNPLSFVNDTGIMAWLNASYQTMIEMAFNISTPQYLLVLSWLGNFITTLTPLLIEAETGYTIPQLAQLAFYEQWANGTIQGESILPGGFLSQLDPSFAGAPYFEIGIPTPSTFSLPLTIALWDESDPDTFVNMVGIEIWLGAVGGSTANITYLATTFAPFGLTQSNLTTILLPWLGNFYAVRVPQLLEYQTGYTVPELAQFAIYEQWANGTIYGLSILPEGFLSLRDPPIYGPPYFEVGLTEGATGLTIPQCMALWNRKSGYSLINYYGLRKWYDAPFNGSRYVALKLNNGGLNDVQMEQILDWLPQFRDIIVNKLAKDDQNLPMEPYDLGSTINLGLGIAGGVLAALGVVVLILSKRL